ncbi:MAG: AraC family transcriptional regulator [Gorillibacterium sp.]|nr:AraC family transcriptional regulator [Gorillibacterium sp.]
MQNTPNKVGDIALQIGYINSSHFGRIFKETVGVTPAEFRRLHQ